MILVCWRRCARISTSRQAAQDSSRISRTRECPYVSPQRSRLPAFVSRRKRSPISRAARRRAARDRLGALAGDPVEPDAPSGSRGRGTSMIPVRVLLADDHALVRAGIRALLEGLEGVTVVAEAGNGGEVLELARKHRPDVVLLDISMPGLGGLEASALLKQDLPEVRVLMLSMHANEEYVLQALRAGASGYMLKDSATAELELALQAVMQGETYL